MPTLLQISHIIRSLSHTRSDILHTSRHPPRSCNITEKNWSATVKPTLLSRSSITRFLFLPTLLDTSTHWRLDRQTRAVPDTRINADKDDMISDERWRSEQALEETLLDLFFFDCFAFCLCSETFSSSIILPFGSTAWHGLNGEWA